MSYYILYIDVSYVGYGDWIMKSFRRPAGIIISSIIILAMPVFTILINSAIQSLPLSGAESIFSKMRITDVLILLVYLIAAVSVFTVTKAGWWLFIASAAGIFAYNIIVYSGSPLITVIGVLLFNVILFAVAGFFFRKHIIAPYFNPRLRWWEQASRYNVDLGVSLEYSDSYEIGYLEDLSLGGCFIRISEKISVGKTYPLKMSLGNEMSISINGRIMRAVTDDCSLPGYGVMFANLTTTEQEGLRRMIEGLYKLGLGDIDGGKSDSNKREHDRYPVNISVSFRYEGEILPARLINFSSTGACLETMMNMEMGEFCGFYCTLGYNSADVDGVIKWKKQLEHHKQYGISFINQTRKQKADIIQMLNTIRALGGRVRQHDSEEYNRLVERTLPGTPYRVFYRNRKS